MTSYLLAGGGTAGHVNPMLAIADEIRRTEPDARIVMIGTKEGLESRLVPQRGYDLHTIPRLPFPRRPDARAVTFVRLWRRTVADIVGVIRDRNVDVVIGVGGYAAAPAYAAGRKAGVPIVIHEANAKPGLANILGARWTKYVGVAFTGTKLPHARFVGMPLRPEIAKLDVKAEQVRARATLGFNAAHPVVLVTGGSLGATRINEAVVEASEELARAGIQVLHITGDRFVSTIPEVEGYRAMAYCDDMAQAFGAASLVVCRAGASTVSEVSAIGLPAVYIPYPVGNGEQALNAREAVTAGAAILVKDADFNSAWIRDNLIALASSNDRLAAMRTAAEGVGVRSGSQLTVALIREALTESSAKRA